MRKGLRMFCLATAMQGQAEICRNQLCTLYIHMDLLQLLKQYRAHAQDVAQETKLHLS